MPDFTVHWHQSNPDDVVAWEFQFQRVGAGSDGWEWVQRVTSEVDDCLDCFQAIVSIPRTALFVRSRGVGEWADSDWSNPLHVMPEPSFSLMLCVSILALLLAHRSRMKSSKS